MSAQPIVIVRDLGIAAEKAARIHRHESVSGRPPEGRLMDERNIGHYARYRSQLKLFFFKPTRAKIKKRLLEMGHNVIRRSPKHRYVQFCGSPALKRELMDALQWNIFPYPK